MKVYGEGLINDRAVEIDLPIYDFKGRNERRPSDPDDKILKRILKQKSTSINKRYSKKVEYITINCLPLSEEIRES